MSPEETGRQRAADYEARIRADERATVKERFNAAMKTAGGLPRHGAMYYHPSSIKEAIDAATSDALDAVNEREEPSDA